MKFGNNTKGTGLPQDPGNTPWLMLAGKLALFLLIYSILAWFSIHFLTLKPPYFTLWLPSGLLVVALARSPARHWPGLASIALTINILCGVLAQMELRMTMAFALGSWIESLGIAGLGLAAISEIRRRAEQAGAEVDSRESMRDITQEKKAARERIETELTARALLDAIPDMAILVDPDGIILAANQRSAARRPLDEITGAFVYDLVPPDWVQTARKEIEDTFAGGEPLQTVYQINGRYIEHQVLPIFNASGKVVRLAMIDRDISQRVKADSDRKRWKEVFYNSKQAMSFSFGSDRRLDEVNPAFADLFGYTLDEITGMSIDALYPPETRENGRNITEHINHDGHLVRETNCVRKDGSIIPVELTATAVKDVQGNVLYRIASVQDITRRKQTEEMLHFQAHLLDVVSQAIITTDLTGKITYWNRAATELFGWKAAEATGKDFNELVARHASPQEKLDTINWLTSGGSWSGETTLHRRDQTTFLGQVDEMPILDDTGRLVGIISVTQDITTRRSAEDALRKSNFMRDILSASLMNTPLALVFWKMEKDRIEVIDWNPAAETIFGWPREEVIGRNFYEFLPATPAPNFTTTAVEMLEHGCLPNTLEMECRTRRGDPVLVNWFNTPLADLENAGIYVLSLGENISERRHAEEQVRVSLQEKEILLREVYHRVKNNLMVMISLIDLQSATISDERTLAILKDLQARVRTMAMVHQSLYQSPSLSQVDFESYLVTLISYLSSLYASARRIQFTYEVENLVLPIEMAIPCGLIINELVSNAYKYAFRGENNQDPTCDPCLIFVGFKKINEHFILEVRDNGVGLPGEVDVANAQSLGIQLVRLLTSQIDGRLEVEREMGTQFRITFSDPKNTL